MTENGTALSLRDVRKTYPGSPPVESVRGVTLDITQGEMVATPDFPATERWRKGPRLSCTSRVTSVPSG